MGIIASAAAVTVVDLTSLGVVKIALELQFDFSGGSESPVVLVAGGEEDLQAERSSFTTSQSAERRPW